MTRRVRLLLLSATAAALFLPGTASAQQGSVLNATVGPGFTISLTDSSGAAVSRLDPGTYEIVVSDRSEFHNFHISGANVDQRTAVPFVGSATFIVTFSAGTYTYVCDPHAASMRGSFTVGFLAPPPPGQEQPKAVRLNATVGPGFTIGLRTAAAALVRSLKAGAYTVVVRDRSRIHNFHLTGPGVNRATKVAFVGMQTWNVTFRKGATYRILCDPHAKTMKASFRAL